MNKHFAKALQLRVVRAGCARILANSARSIGLLRLVKTPAQESFIAFAQAMVIADPDTATRCERWTVHELTAHLTAGSREFAELIELKLAGAPPRPTRDFDEREEPYRQLAPRLLRRRFFEEAFRATVAVDRLSRIDGDRRVVFTGTSMEPSDIVLHIESELVLHRWDIVGDDPVSVRALSRPDLTVHAATTVTNMQPNVFAPRGDASLSSILRSPQAPDVLVSGGSIAISSEADPSLPVVHCHPALRALMLWGRTSSHLPSPVGDPDVVGAVIAMLVPSNATALTD